MSLIGIHVKGHFNAGSSPRANRGHVPPSTTLPQENFILKVAGSVTDAHLRGKCMSPQASPFVAVWNQDIRRGDVEAVNSQDQLRA